MTKKTRFPLLAALVLLTACNGFKTQPYEAGPYALGIISATLSWKQLKPYLK